MPPKIVYLVKCNSNCQLVKWVLFFLGQTISLVLLMIESDSPKICFEWVIIISMTCNVMVAAISHRPSLSWLLENPNSKCQQLFFVDFLHLRRNVFLKVRKIWSCATLLKCQISAFHISPRVRTRFFGSFALKMPATTYFVKFKKFCLLMSLNLFYVKKHDERRQIMING